MLITTKNTNKNCQQDYGNINTESSTRTEISGNGYNYIIDGDCFRNKNIPSKGISGFNYVANRLLQENNIYNQPLKPKEIKKDKQYVTFKLYIGDTSSYIDATYDISNLKLDMFYVP